MVTRRPRPPPADGGLDLLGASTVSATRGWQPPLGSTTRPRESAPYTFGVDMVLLVARGDRGRIPVALERIDPSIRGPLTIRCREMLKAFVPPGWTCTCVGVAAHATLRVIMEANDGAVGAMPQTRKFPHGKQLRELVPHLPTCSDQRRARDAPDGRRTDAWGFARRATHPQRGEVTLVLSTPRRVGCAR
jgi:hypothetical protein